MLKSIIIIIILINSDASDITFGDISALNASVTLRAGATLSWSFLDTETVAFMLDYPF